MPQPPAPLIPAAIWPRVHDLFLDLVERTSREADELLLEEEPDVRYWVKELLEAEPFDIEPINFRKELSRLRLGTVVGTRYLLERFLGMGGFGDVYEALDQVTNETVAVKLVPESPDDGSEPHEWATLRVIDLPGVVSLLDVCHEEQHSVLVMPLLEGAPFPGGEARSLEALTECTVSLLESLERLHAAGFVHGDLKPQNILVDDGGRPSILDLGVAQRWRRPAFLSFDRIAVSPEYAAPEVLRGERATPSADLYSLGIMLYEAIGGELPSIEAVGGSLGRLPFVPLHKACPDFQNELTELVDRLLGFGTRPESATDALSLLGRGTLEERIRCHVGYLGSKEEVDDLVHALRTQQSVEVVGRRQSGKTALLEEVESLLTDDGDLVLRLPGDVDEILGAVCPPEEIAALGRWENLRGLVISRLREERESGSFLLFDDFDKLNDEEFVREILTLKEGGGVLLARTSAVETPSPVLAALDLATLEECFEGPNVILHLREDAAKELCVRTRGLRGRVIRELAAWVRAGIAKIGDDSGRIAISRGCLHRLAHTVPGPLRAPSPQKHSMGETERRMLAIAQMVPEGATVEFWEQVEPGLALHLDTNLAALLECGSVEEKGERYHVTARVPLADVLSPREQERIHLAIADSLPKGDPRRVQFRILGGDPDGATEEALEVGRCSLAHGQPSAALSVLLEGLRNLKGDDVESRAALLAELTEATLTLQSLPAIQRALHELELAAEPKNVLSDLSQILALALRLQTHDPSRTLTELKSAPSVREPRWKRWFAVLLSHASRITGEPRLQTEACRLLTELSQGGDSAASRELSVILGFQHYVQGNLEAAARFRTRAVSLAPDPARKCAGLISLATSEMELGHWGQSVEALEQAHELATEHRFSMQEARCWWLRSSLAYRRGRPEAVGEEVFAAIETLGLRDLAAQLHLTEGARLWRESELGEARDHAQRALGLWGDSKGSPGFCVSHALAIAAGMEVSEEELEELLEGASELPLPGAALQASALISSAFPGIVSQNEARARSVDRAAARFAPQVRSLRREVMSITEAERLISGKQV